MSGATLAPELQEPLEIPDELPLLPVRDVVVFPAMVVPLFVSRVFSLNAVEAAQKNDRFVFVCAQRDGKDDAPRVPEDVFKLGTVCLILRQRRLPDGRIKVLVQGLQKATLESVVAGEPVTRVKVAKIHELPFDAQGDGPSAGTTMACALASLLLGRPCKKGGACADELTLRGRILAVGGLREKLLAAARAGLDTVCIPRQNARDLLDLPRSLRRRVKLVQAGTLDELLAVALVGGLPEDQTAGLRVAAPAR
jgi:ATP-dependent Lon protease